MLHLRYDALKTRNATGILRGVFCPSAVAIVKKLPGLTVDTDGNNPVDEIAGGP
jgi:hypothetical protein